VLEIQQSAWVHQLQFQFLMCSPLTPSNILVPTYCLSHYYCTRTWLCSSTDPEICEQNITTPGGGVVVLVAKASSVVSPEIHHLRLLPSRRARVQGSHIQLDITFSFFPTPIPIVYSSSSSSSSCPPSPADLVNSLRCDVASSACPAWQAGYSL